MMIGSDSNTLGQFPAQKIPDSKKNEEWYKACLDASLSLAAIDEGASKHKMNVYANLDNDIIDEAEIEAVFNPLQIEYAAFPASLKNYPLSVPKIDLLQGEEIKRRFEFNVKSKNDNAYSSHQSDLQKMLMEILMDELTKEEYDEQIAEARLKKFSKYSKYEWKDTHELTATRILQYLWREQDLQYTLNKGFRDALVMGQEIYRIDVIGNEPRVVKVDPRKVYAVRRGDSERIEDADIIMEIDYVSIGTVIDEFHDFLKPEEIDDLENSLSGLVNSSSSVLRYEHTHPPIYSNIDPGTANGFLPLSSLTETWDLFSLPYDKHGNVRVVRSRWKGRREIGRLTFFDEEGNEQNKLVPSGYKPDVSAGEMVKWIWINEAYESTLLGKNIYVKMQPREVQMRHFDNISSCFLGYVGTDYGKSLMSRMESYQYAFNVYMRRLELIMAKYKGPIYELDISKIPDGWEMDKWMYYADVLGWAPVDPFNEVKSGPGTGKLSGTFNTTGKVLDPNIGNYIQQTIMMLQYIETQMGEISGVTKQRQGQIENRETVGGVERSVAQSSHITEKWFFVHDETKRRVLHALLDTAKYAWKKINSKKLNYVLDDMSRVFIEFQPTEIASTEFDLFVSNSTKDFEIKEIIKQLAQAGIQNGLGMAPMIQALREDSITTMARIIEEAEDLSFQRQSESSKQEIELEKIKQDILLSEAAKDRELRKYEIDSKMEIEREKLGVSIKNIEEQDTFLDEAKLNIQRDKQLLEERKLQSDISLKTRDLKEKERSNKAKESISRSKPTSSNK